MNANANNNKVPLQKTTPLTWLYVAFAVAVVVLTIWGFVDAGNL